MRLSNFGAVRLPLLAAAVLALFACPVSAQIVERSQTWDNLIATHPCNAGMNGRHTILTDAQSSSSIGGGGGSVRVFVECDGVDTWSIVSIGGGGVDLSAYALLAGRAEGQTLHGIPEPQGPRLVLGATTASLIGNGEFYAGVFIDGPIAKLEADTGIGQRNGVEVGQNYININLNGTSGVIALDGTAFRLGLVPVIPSGDSPPTCDSALVSGPEAKALYIDNTTGTGTLCMCNGSSWSVLAPAGGSCG